MVFSSRLIEPLAPLIRHPPIINWSDKAAVNWTLRPFWVIEDLRLMHHWLNSNRVLCNKPVDRDRLPLIFHYMQLLQSPSQQALVLERNGTVVGQFDVIRQKTYTDGLLINYNFPDVPDSPGYWEVGITQLVRILNREVPREFIYIEIPKNYFALLGLAEQIGFVTMQQFQLKEMYCYRYMGNST